MRLDETSRMDNSNNAGHARPVIVERFWAVNSEYVGIGFLTIKNPDGRYPAKVRLPAKGKPQPRGVEL